MDLIKKHFEKLVLALTLLVLIVAAAILSFKVGNLSADASVSPATMKGKAVKPVDVAGYSNAIAALSHPLLWTEAEPDPFRTSPPVTVHKPDGHGDADRLPFTV